MRRLIKSNDDSFLNLINVICFTYFSQVKLYCAHPFTLWCEVSLGLSPYGFCLEGPGLGLEGGGFGLKIIRTTARNISLSILFNFFNFFPTLVFRGFKKNNNNNSNAGMIKSVRSTRVFYRVLFR